MEVLIVVGIIIVIIALILFLVFLSFEYCNLDDKNNSKRVDIYNQEGDYEYSYYEQNNKM